MEPASLVGGVEILRFYGDEAFTVGFLIEPPKEWNVTRVLELEERGACSMQR